MKIIDCPLCQSIGTLLSNNCECLVCKVKLAPSEFNAFYRMTLNIQKQKQKLKDLVVKYVRRQEIITQKYNGDDDE